MCLGEPDTSSIKPCDNIRGLLENTLCSFSQVVFKSLFMHVRTRKMDIYIKIKRRVVIFIRTSFSLKGKPFTILGSETSLPRFQGREGDKDTNPKVRLPLSKLVLTGTLGRVPWHLDHPYPPPPPPAHPFRTGFLIETRQRFRGLNRRRKQCRSDVQWLPVFSSWSW